MRCLTPCHHGSAWGHRCHAIAEWKPRHWSRLWSSRRDADARSALFDLNLMEPMPTHKLDDLLEFFQLHQLFNLFNILASAGIDLKNVTLGNVKRNGDH